VYVNDDRVSDPAGHEMDDGDNVLVAYGSEGSFPSEPRAVAFENA